MCFNNDFDYDWYPELQEEADHEAGPPAWCVECGKRIQAHHWRRRLYQQENEDEDCQDCLGDGKCDDMPCPECRGTGQRGKGNTFSASTCRPCCQMLDAIQEVEGEEGCPPHTQRPQLQELWEEMRNMGASATAKYRVKALGRHPELAGHIKEMTRED